MGFSTAVQQDSTGGTGLTQIQLSVTVGADVPLVVHCVGPNGTTFTVTSALSGALSSKVGPTQVSGGESQVFERDHCTAGADTITIVPNGGASTQFWGAGVLQGDAGQTFDAVSPINVQTTGTARITANVTPTSQPGTMLALTYNDTQNNSGSIGSGFTAVTGPFVTAGRYIDVGSANNFCFAEYKDYSALSAIAGAATYATGSTTGMTALLFKSAGGGGGSPTTTQLERGQRGYNRGVNRGAA